jgi:hypothetical protein
VTMSYGFGVSSALRSLTIAVALTAIVVAAGVVAHRPARPATAPPLTLGAPLASVDTTVLSVSRAPFCRRVPRADLVAALGGPLRSASAYSPGQTATVAHGVRDVADEYSCTWHGASTTARGWVFAPPVARSWARTLAVVPRGCRTVAAGRYGKPSLAFSCGRTTTLAGLFGDAWLSCSLTATTGQATPAAARVGRWCVAVARAAH